MVLLGVQFLNFIDLNHYTVVPNAQIVQSTNTDVYFRLVDNSQTPPVPYTPSIAGIAGASGSVLLTGITSGSIVALQVAGTTFIQGFDTDIPTTVIDLANQINTNALVSALVIATPSGNNVLLQAPPALGALGNGFGLSALIATGTGAATASGAYLTGGVGNGSASLQAQVLNIDDSKVVTRFASQPYGSLAPSIWKLSLFGSDPTPAGTANFRITLNEGAKQSIAYVQGGILVYSTTQNAGQTGSTCIPFPGYSTGSF